MVKLEKSNIFKDLQSEILALQGLKAAYGLKKDIGLGPVLNAFPNGTFPTGAVHEFISEQYEDSAATTGFIAGLLSALMDKKGAALWISAGRTIFPPGLKKFGIEPDHFIFLDLKKEQDVFWAMDEALKCQSLSAVVSELHNLDFTSSRRLQLSVEQSHVTGFILRKNIRAINTTACVSRWKITPLASELEKLPGLGFPRWQVELLRMRNGKAGSWNIQWMDGRFIAHEREQAMPALQRKKAG